MIVISIIIILVSVALPQFQKTIMHARETVLKDDLHKMRELIDQYAADKGKLPQSLDDLVTAGYMRELPKDPITDNKDWVIATGDDPYSTQGGTGITDVHSASGDVSSEGTPYSEVVKHRLIFHFTFSICHFGLLGASSSSTTKYHQSQI